MRGRFWGHRRRGGAGTPRAGTRLPLRWLIVPVLAAALLLAARSLPGLPALVFGGEPCVPGDGRFLGIHRGRVAVFDGVPGGCRRLRQQLDLSAAGLPPFQQEALEAGVPFESEVERLQIMEGLESEASK